jgi:tRNA dimethylallyltransferase
VTPAIAPPRLVVIVGPTGAGKSQLALRLAHAVDGDIVSADSQQVYRGMDIGTGKASAADRARVRHHLLDIVAPDDEMTAARFATCAAETISEIAAQGRVAIVCGGTGLYVRALLFGLFAGPPADAALRAELDAVALRDGTPALWARLSPLDQESAARINPNDRKRLIRALEVVTTTGVTLAEHHRRHDHRSAPARYPYRMLGVAPERAALYATIERRVDAMVDAGLVDEVRGLRAAGYLPPLRSQQAIGYAEIHAHVAGEYDWARALELVKRNSRHYARRQLSWYRGDDAIAWTHDATTVDLAPTVAYLRGAASAP